MNDWLDYKGSGSVQSAAAEDYLNLYHALPSIAAKGARYTTNSPYAKSGINLESMTKDDKAYKQIDSELNTVYSELASVKSALSNAAQAYNQFVTAAKTFRARGAIANTKLKQAQSKLNSIESEIDRSGSLMSSMQRTAITNKYNNIKKNKYGEALKGMNFGDSGVDFNELTSLAKQISLFYAMFRV